MSSPVNTSPNNLYVFRREKRLAPVDNSYWSKFSQLIGKIGQAVKEIFAWIGSQFANLGTWFINRFASNSKPENHPSGVNSTTGDNE